MDNNTSSNTIYRNGIDLDNLENYEKTEAHSEKSFDKNITDCEVNKEHFMDKIKNPDDSSNVLRNTPIECTQKVLDSEYIKENNGLSELKVQLDDAVSKLQIHQSANQTSESIIGNKMNLVVPIEKSNNSEPDQDYVSLGCFSTGSFDLDSENKSSINGNSTFSGNARSISSGTVEAHEKNASGNDSFCKRNDTKQIAKLELGTDVENQHALSDSVSSNTSKMIIIPELSDDKNSKSHIFKDHELNLRVQANNLTLKEENDLELNKDDIEDDSDTICGIGSFNPKWLQAWANPRVFLTLYSLLGVISGMYYSYRVGALTTLEKRFSFNSQMSGTVMMVDEITPVFLGAIVGYFGGKGHRPRMFGIGMVMSTFCCFVSAFPYFIYGTSSHLNIQNVQNKSGVEICEEEIRVENCNADDRPPTVTALFFLMLAGVLKGFGNLGYWSLGLSYMDDISKKKNTAIYFAVTFSLRLVGPVFGYLMSSFFLKFYENPLEDPGYGPEDPRWIGAWWIGFLVQGVLQLLLTIPLALFPRRLPGQKRLPTNSEANDKLSSGFKGLIAALKRLLKNPLYLSIVVNTIMNIFGSVGHFMMLPKYMEQQFRLTASDASLYSVGENRVKSRRRKENDPDERNGQANAEI
ncbi:solute carrier organic anion transporter family member 3A1 [Trichonephila clavipes]|uniref:Solute carrier organic anion transporter family member 3A1 n=1 Tax=Trichonephila clavipes TaxID=2585209 RepID=A0A8X6SG02_TRICX|nr:solute carrier organic anion transporter family member 3A1 [Trichonephila clavipes]